MTYKLVRNWANRDEVGDAESWELVTVKYPQIKALINVKMLFIGRILSVGLSKDILKIKTLVIKNKRITLAIIAFNYNIAYDKLWKWMVANHLMYLKKKSGAFNSGSYQLVVGF